MEKVLLSTAYLPPVIYYALLFGAPQSSIEAHCNYVKQTYRNRCNIVEANGIMPLSIPIEKSNVLKCYTKDIRISEHGNWQHLHWNALVSAYRSSPFFEYYASDFEPFYKQKFTFLFDLNEQMRHMIMSLIDIPDITTYSVEYVKQPLDTIDLRESIHPKRPMPSVCATVPYYQVFAAKFGFIPDMSIVDLLFNMGPQSLIVLRDMVKESM